MRFSCLLDLLHGFTLHTLSSVLFLVSFCLIELLRKETNVMPATGALTVVSIKRNDSENTRSKSLKPHAFEPDEHV